MLRRTIAIAIIDCEDRVADSDQDPGLAERAQEVATSSGDEVAVQIAGGAEVAIAPAPETIVAERLDERTVVIDGKTYVLDEDVEDEAPAKVFDKPRVCEVNGRTYERHEGSVTSIGWVSFEAQREAHQAANSDPVTTAMAAARDARIAAQAPVEDAATQAQTEPASS
jgi:hypothetical protein